MDEWASERCPVLHLGERKCQFEGVRIKDEMLLLLPLSLCYVCKPRVSSSERRGKIVLPI